MTQEFLPNAVQIALGSDVVDIYPQPLARIKRFKKAWAMAFENFDKLQAEFSGKTGEDEPTSSDEIFDRLTEFVFDIPYELLEIGIPSLDRKYFEDEENGVTVPQIWAAFDAILEVNELEVLKKITPLFQDMILSIDPSRERTRARARTVSSLEQSSEPASAKRKSSRKTVA